MHPEAWWALPLPDSPLLQLAAHTVRGLVVRRRPADDAECLEPTLLPDDECVLFDIEAQELRYVRGDESECPRWAAPAEFSMWEAMAVTLGWIAR